MEQPHHLRGCHCPQRGVVMRLSLSAFAIVRVVPGQRHHDRAQGSLQPLLLQLQLFLLQLILVVLEGWRCQWL